MREDFFSLLKKNSAMIIYVRTNCPKVRES